MTQVAVKAIDGILPGSGRMRQLGLTVYVSSMALLFAFEGLWGEPGEKIYLLTGVLGLCVAVFGLLAGRLYVKTDMILLVLFLLSGWVSGVAAFGFSAAFFRSRFFLTWMVFLALYVAVQRAPEPRVLVRSFCCVFSVALSFVCLYVLAHASASLLSDPPGRDYIVGCFHLGRLFALGNANSYGFVCVALVMVSAAACVEGGTLSRLWFGCATLLGWLSLGLTGCRSGEAAVSSALALFVFSLLYGRLRRSKPGAAAFLAAFAAAALTFVLALESFLLSGYLYRSLLGVWGRFTGRDALVRNLSALVARRMSDDDGTMTDRTLIWSQTLKAVFRNERRFLLGVSPLSEEGINGVYPGRHDILIGHAHNTYLEVLRRNGLIGLLLLVLLLLMWCGRGVSILAHGAAADRALMACAAGLLVLGLAEPLPFSYIMYRHCSLLFFLICGYGMRIGGTKP